MANGTNDLQNLLLQNIDKEIEIVIEKQDWGKDLKDLPMFTIKEIDDHRVKSGKRGKAIIKTMDRGRKFMEEGYINKNSIFTRSTNTQFDVKAECKASMKREIRNINVSLSRTSGKVERATCTCPAGNSGYCNHVMGLLFELADFSLHQKLEVPEELACTSTSRRWGVPSDTYKYPKPAMNIAIRKNSESRGVSCTLYNPRVNADDTFLQRVAETHLNIVKTDKNIGYGHVINFSMPKVPTKYGEYATGSPLSNQLSVFEGNFKVISDIKQFNGNKSEHIDINLPFQTISMDSNYFPKDWGNLTYVECMILNGIFPETIENSQQIEKDTIGQSDNPKWFNARKNRITSSNCHKVFVRQKNFETLTGLFTDTKSERDLPKMVQDAMKHGRTYEPVAKEKFGLYMKYTMKRDVKIRDTGIVVQPFLFWLAASPDGLISDTTENLPGLIEIKCPKTKRNWSPDELLDDGKFYVGRDQNGKLYLKKDHHFGYYSQIQLAMGLAQLPYCYFIVYTFKGLLIVKSNFDEQYFQNLIIKLNSFYRRYLLKVL